MRPSAPTHRRTTVLACVLVLVFSACVRTVDASSTLPNGTVEPSWTLTTLRNVSRAVDGADRLVDFTLDAFGTSYVVSLRSKRGLTTHARLRWAEESQYAGRSSAPAGKAVAALREGGVTRGQIRTGDGRGVTFEKASETAAREYLSRVGGDAGRGSGDWLARTVVNVTRLAMKVPAGDISGMLALAREAGASVREGRGIAASERRGRRLEVQTHATPHVELVVLNDKARCDMFINNWDLEEDTVYVVNVVNSLYEGEFNPPIVMVLKEMVSFADGDPYTHPIEPTSLAREVNASELLDVVDNWRRDNQDILESHDIVHLFSGLTFAGQTIGIAYVDSVCSDFPTGLSQVHYGYSEINAHTVAHEIGHQLGFTHDHVDNDLCDASSYIMSTTITQTTPQSDWSECTRMEYEAFIDGHKCLYQSGVHKEIPWRLIVIIICVVIGGLSMLRTIYIHSPCGRRRRTPPRFTGYAVSQPPPYPPPYAPGAQGTRGAQVMAMGIPHPMQQPAFMGTPYATQQQHARPVTAQTQHGASYYPSM